MDQTVTDEWLTLAKVVRPQGRRGEVLCDLLTDFPDQFATRKDLFLLLPNGARSSVTVDDHWLPVGRSAGRVVLKLAGTDSITAAEGISGAKVQITQNERLAVDDETYYVSDLVGCVMVDGENEIGLVQDLHFPHDSDGKRLDEAAPLFVVERLNGDEVLIPFANAFVRRVSIAEKRIEMNLPGGLLEMNG
jgi:16S rRNA processing protein RimM